MVLFFVNSAHPNFSKCCRWYMETNLTQIQIFTNMAVMIGALFFLVSQISK